MTPAVVYSDRLITVAQLYFTHCTKKKKKYEYGTLACAEKFESQFVRMFLMGMLGAKKSLTENMMVRKYGPEP